MFLEISGKNCVPLEDGQLYMIGKQLNGIENISKNFIQLEEEQDVNERHCIIEISQKEVAFVFDLLSPKGTLLNNKPLKGLEKTRLENGDILKFGKHEVKYIHERHDLSNDSSGFIETSNSNSLSSDFVKNVSNKFIVPAVPHKKFPTPIKSLNTSESEDGKSPLSTSTASFNNRRSVSFTIPETQYNAPPNSLNVSDISVPANITDGNGCKVKFNFSNLDDFDDELCIPETQEIVETCVPHSSDKRPREFAGSQNIDKTNSILKERSAKLENESNTDGSQFRICTQDYNEGFGEEESVEELHSQIIPFIKHATIVITNTSQCSKNDSNKEYSKEKECKDMSSLRWSTSKIDQDTTEFRDCVTPDIFELDGLEEDNNKDAAVEKTDEKISQSSKDQAPVLLEEDEEDLLPTQVFSPCFRKENILNEPEKPCLEKENEEVLTLSDKENRCPVDTLPDLLPTQLFEATRSSNTSSCSRDTIIATKKINNTITAQSSTSKCLINIDDNEDDILTEAFLQPPSHHPLSSTSSAFSKSTPSECFNSTLLDDKVLPKNPANLFEEIEKPLVKQTFSPAPAAAFKKPDKDCLPVKKTSMTSETDLDLLMCTPQIIKDNIIVGGTEDLKKNILAAKNKDLFGDNTEEEDNDDDQGDLVKLINVPKNSLDFDKLLLHLNTKPQQKSSKINEEVKSAKEAQKIYKFNISFGKDHDKNRSNSPVSKSSTYSRDERHAARYKSKEMEERKGKTVKEERSRTRNRSRSRNRTPEKDGKEVGRKHRETSLSKNETRTRESNARNKKIKFDLQIEEKETASNKEGKNTRSRKMHAATAEKSETVRKSLEEKVESGTPARRITRSKSRHEAVKATEFIDGDQKTTRSKEKNADNNFATGSTDRVSRRRHNIKQADSLNSLSDRSSSTTTATNATAGAKRKTVPPQTVVPVKVERKSINTRDSTARTYSKPAVIISMTMVDPNSFQNLAINSNGFWTVAKNPIDSSVLVMDKPFRTFKFLLAMARGIPIVTSDYLKKLNETQSKKGIRISDFLFEDAEFEKKYKFSLTNSLQAAKKKKILESYEFLMTPNIVPNPEEIKAIIEASGGSVYDKIPPPPKDNQRLYLVTSKEDKKEWHKYRRVNKYIKIVSTEAIMSAVMRQNCEIIENYMLS